MFQNLIFFVPVVLSESTLCFIKSISKTSRNIMRWNRGLLGGSAEQEVKNRGELQFYFILIDFTFYFIVHLLCARHQGHQQMVSLIKLFIKV